MISNVEVAIDDAEEPGGDGSCKYRMVTYSPLVAACPVNSQGFSAWHDEYHLT